MTTSCPDGISEEDARPHTGRHGRASPASFIILAALLLLALTGLFGGDPNPVRTAETDAARIEVKAPAILRNGMTFETVIRIMPKRPVGALTLAIAPSFWRNITINDMVPAADQEEMRDGLLRFTYGSAEPGHPVEIRINGQINPPLFGGAEGEIAVYDADRRLVGLTASMRVRP